MTSVRWDVFLSSAEREIVNLSIMFFFLLLLFSIKVIFVCLFGFVVLLCS